MQMLDPANPGELLKEDVLGPAGLSVTRAAEILGVGRPPLWKRLNHLAAVLAHTPKDLATSALPRPETMALATSARLFGVNAAFLWMFIRSSSKVLQFRNHSFLHLDRMDNLLRDHI
jgi:hypothetical protein